MLKKETSNGKESLIQAWEKESQLLWPPLASLDIAWRPHQGSISALHHGYTLLMPFLYKYPALGGPKGIPQAWTSLARPPSSLQLSPTSPAFSTYPSHVLPLAGVPSLLIVVAAAFCCTSAASSCCCAIPTELLGIPSLLEHLHVPGGLEASWLTIPRLID